MKALWYVILMVSLVPIQSVLLPLASLWGVAPDLSFIVVCLVGLFGGELEGLFVGLALGWIMSLFSAQSLIVSMITKGGMGYVAGLAGRHVVYLTPVVLTMGLFLISCLTGLAMAVSRTGTDQQSLWWAIRAVVLPQAVLDSVVGGVLYWAVWSRSSVGRWVSDHRM